MKKLLLVIAMVAVGFTANSQDIKFGVKAGLNIANLKGNDNFKVDSRTGFHVGGMVNFKLSDAFAIQPELLYSTQGASNKVAGTDITFRMDYITLPIMAKYYIVEGFNVQAGPQLGFNINAEVEGNGRTIDVKKYLGSEEKGFDFGLNFGLGYELPLGLTFDARYNLGLTDIFKENKGDAVKNSVFQISVGYFF